MLDDSGIRQSLKGVRLYDINANTQAYTDPAGKPIEAPITIKDGSTEPESLAEFFKDTGNQKFLGGFECIIFKSCYTANSLKADARMRSQISAYENIRGYIQDHPKQTFIFCTSPPRRPLLTSKKAASRAKQVRQWIIDNTKPLGNVKVLDIFGLLANEKGMLSKKYRRWIFYDQHPNRRGSIIIGDHLQRLLTD